MTRLPNEIVMKIWTCIGEIGEPQDIENFGATSKLMRLLGKAVLQMYFKTTTRLRSIKVDHRSDQEELFIALKDLLLNRHLQSYFTGVIIGDWRDEFRRISNSTDTNSGSKGQFPAYNKAQRRLFLQSLEDFDINNNHAVENLLVGY